MVASILAAAVTGGGLQLGLIVTTYSFGLRHGIDWDHIAAIADIAGSQESPRRSLALSTLYVLGHASVVFVLGVVAIVFAERLPTSVDGVMERVVGVTLLALGAYVFYGLVRHGRDFRLRSRWMLVFAGIRHLARRWRRPQQAVVVVAHGHEHPADEPHPVGSDRRTEAAVAGAPGQKTLVAPRHSHHHRHVAPMPDDPLVTYGRATSFGVGMIHGVGAETPTQVLLFLTAAGAGGTGVGVVLLVCFLAGLITSNTGIAVATTFGFLSTSGNFRAYVAVSVLIATFSLVLGAMFVIGAGGALPAIFGG